MKKTLKTAMLAIALFLIAFAGLAQQNTLVLKNNTGKKLIASFVYYDSGENCWVSRGWRTIQPYASNTIYLDELSMGSNVMYVHGETLFKTWDGDFSFCADMGKPFRILFADQVNCNTKKRYTQVTIGDGQNSYVFNP